MASIKSIHVFPLRGFDGVEVASVELRENGGIRGDREFKFLGIDGSDLDDQRPDRRQQKVRVAFDNSLQTAHFSMSETVVDSPASATFDLVKQPDAAAAWMSQALGYPVALHHEPGGYYYDEHLTGPTFIGEGMLAGLTEHLGHDDMARRLRMNFVVEGLSDLQEQRLALSGTSIQIGDEATFVDATPTVRCNVIRNDPVTGAPDAQMLKALRQYQEPAYARTPEVEYPGKGVIAGHNTAVESSQAGKQISSGDNFTWTRGKSTGQTR